MNLCLFYFSSAERAALVEIAGVLHRHRCDGLQGLAREECLMAREDDLREHEQAARDVFRRNVGAVIRVDIGVLALVDIERDRMELALLESSDERFRIDEAAACSVREHDIVLHEGDGLIIDEMIRAAFAHDERCVDGDEVRATQDLFLRGIGEKTLFLELLVRECIPADDRHAVALADARHALADAARAEDTGDLVVEIDAEQAREVEVVVAHLVVCLVQAAVCSLQRCHGMLCHCVRGVGRYAQDRDAVLGSGLLVDIVEASAAQEDQADAAVMQLLDDRTRCLVVDEDAHSVIAVGELCRLIRQAAREILEFDVVCALALVLCELAEIEAVIVFRAEKGDLEDRTLLLLRTHGIENRLDLPCSLFLIGAVHGDIDRCAFRGVKVQDLQHVVALGRLITDRERHRCPQVAACLRDLRCRTRMDTD